MDKSWINLKRVTNEYKCGLNKFLDRAFECASRNGVIRCPCKKCYCRTWHQRITVYEHLVLDGMDKSYKNGPWVDHGESYRDFYGISSSENELRERDGTNDLLNKVLCPTDVDDGVPSPSTPLSENHFGRTLEADRFYKLLAEADKDLYPSCLKYKKLDFIVKLYQIKALSGWSDKSFCLLLKLLKDAYPEGETLPDMFYQTKKLIGDLGLTDEKIYACRNDCMLYWKSNVGANNCSHCGLSRWKDEGKKVPVKYFRYFTLTPRLQRLYMSSHTADHMRWHDTTSTKDGVLRHPVDLTAWKNLDERDPVFGAESRNVRLGLASDGFKPFGNISNSYITWPVILMVYNLPPWMCMKQPYMFMSSLISGPKGPGNDIDVYLQPLIEELTELWEVGVKTHDVSNDETLTMRASLLWTINDFPAYASLSGWSTKGRNACPHCNINTQSKWLPKGKKFCYLGHRRFIPIHHWYRRLKNLFNGQEEKRIAPISLSGVQFLEQLQNMTFSFGRGIRSMSLRKKNTTSWKKKNIFFNLPYWESHLLRHNLDVMHIEKNVCESVIGTLLGIEGKTKDGLSTRE